jgi:hypothetical protein
MAIPIDESVFLFFIGAIFIPLISFLIKLIIDIGVIKSKLEQTLNMSKEHDIQIEGIRRNENRINLIESRLDRVERAVDNSRK